MHSSQRAEEIMYRWIVKIFRSLMHDKYDRLLKKYAQESESYDIDQVHSLSLVYLISVEDRRYFSHPGCDVRGIFRALYVFLCKGRIEGASTIEQQLVRVLTGRYERTLRRKLVEIILAMLLSADKSKDEIARLYLSVAYYGWRMKGYRQACVRICRDPYQPNPYELAAIIARLRYPESRKASGVRRSMIHTRARYAMHLSRHTFCTYKAKDQNGTIQDNTVG